MALRHPAGNRFLLHLQKQCYHATPARWTRTVWGTLVEMGWFIPEVMGLVGMTHAGPPSLGMPRLTCSPPRTLMVQSRWTMTPGPAQAFIRSVAAPYQTPATLCPVRQSWPKGVQYQVGKSGPDQEHPQGEPSGCGNSGPSLQTTVTSSGRRPRSSQELSALRRPQRSVIGDQYLRVTWK